MDLSYMEICDECFKIAKLMAPNQKITCQKCGYTHTGVQWQPPALRLVVDHESEERIA